MKENFVEELRWRGLLQDVIPGTEDYLNNQSVTGYIGFDPTADSLHIGHLSQVFTLIRFQKAGHKPIALIGGATGMVGDPSGKSAERNLLDEDALFKNVAGIRRQLERLLDFNSSPTGAELVNNYDWMKEYSFLNFIRDVGKHLTVSYMMAKDSVKNRLENGMSFTEFSYQLLQAFDFYTLYTTRNCKLQMGGSDQWGNITSGAELVRRKAGGDVFALTTQLIKKADGTKFGKTESGSVWLDRTKTSPYKFYQFWINVADADALNYIKMFTFLSREEVDSLIAEHHQDPGKRILQKTLARELTTLVHSNEDYQAAVEASSVLFNGTMEDLTRMNEELFLEVFEGLPQFTLPMSELEQPVNVVELLATKTSIFPSKSEARKMIAGGGVSINKIKIESPEQNVGLSQLINTKYLVVQKGRKNYYLCSIN